MINADNLKKMYMNCIDGNTIFTQLSDEIIKIETTMLYSSNDNIVIYAESFKNGEIHITDGGATINGYGRSVRRTNLETFITFCKTTLNVGYDRKTNELYIESSLDSFYWDMQRLLQVVIELG